VVRSILLERHKNGHYRGLRDLVNRVEISLEQVCILIRSGAFSFVSKEKKELLWDAHFLMRGLKKSKPLKGLFDVEAKEFSLPELWRHPLEDTFDELELIGFPVSASLFDLAEDLPENSLLAKDLVNMVNQTITIIGYLVHVKNTYTKTNQGMQFGTFIDLKGQWIDTVHFPFVVVKYPFRGKGCYEITGKVIEEFRFICIEVQRMRKLAHKTMDETKSPTRFAS